MAIIKCKMCGGDLVIEPDSTVAECEYCGSRQTVPTADNEKKLTLFARANRLRASCEFDKAAGVYESIAADFPEEAEAYWGLVLCRYGIEYVDDPATGKKIPTCHRSSFDSILEDSDFEQALENADVVARKVYREEAKQIEELRKGIIEVSGREEPYDIFICYKETDENGERTIDSVIAQDVYDALTDKGYRVFFSRITLEDKLGQEYEPYIFAALNSAKIMLAFGTDYEYYNAVWVKNEWSRYLKLMASDKTRHLIPCYKGIDAYDMPREFAKLQAQDMGKVGAIQDLLRGIDKLLPKTTPATVVQEKAVVGSAGGNNKIASLLDRGNMALEDGDWAKADSFFEDVLNNDSRNAQAYIGKTLVQEQCRTLDALIRKRKDAVRSVRPEKLSLGPDSVHIRESEEKYNVPGYVKPNTIRELYDFDLSYTSEVLGRKRQYQDEKIWWESHRWLSRAEKFAVGEVAQALQTEKNHLFTQLSDRVKQAETAEKETTAKLRMEYAAHIAQADSRADKLYQDGLARREADYYSLLRKAKTENNPEALRKLALSFDGLGDYQSSRNLAQHCRKRAVEEQAKRDAEAARLRKAQQEEAERQRKARLEEAERQRIIEEQKQKAEQKRMAHEMMITAAIILAVAAALILAIFRISSGKADNDQNASERSAEFRSTVDVQDSISAGFYHTLGVKADGTVVAVGDNDFGQCDVGDWTDIVSISTGYGHAVGLKSNGSVVAVGTNYYGECDVSDWTDIVAVSAGGYHTVGLKSDGTVVAVGYNEEGQCDVSDWTDIAAVSASGGNTVGLKSNGSVVAVGTDYYGECDVSDWTDIVAVSAGWTHTVGLKSNGTLVATGDNSLGQCDVGGWTDIVSVSAGFDHTVGLKLDGTVVSAGENFYSECDVNGWTDIVAISAGGYYTIGLKSDGTVVAVGVNDCGQCNVSDWTDIKLPN